MVHYLILGFASLHLKKLIFNDILVPINGTFLIVYLGAGLVTMVTENWMTLDNTLMRLGGGGGENRIADDSLQTRSKQTNKHPDSTAA